MSTESDWFDETEEKKQLRRKAASKFLAATKDNAVLRKAVTNNPGYAREAFQQLGEITLPPEVQVICVEPERHERAKLVIIVLLDPQKETPAEPYREHWVAAWQPYR